MAQNFSGSKQYYQAGKYANPDFNVITEQIAKSDEDWLQTIAIISRDANKLAAQNAQNVATSIKESNKLNAWALQTATKDHTEVFKNLNRLGVNNPSLINIVNTALKNKTRALTQLSQGGLNKEDTQYYTKLRDTSTHTLTSVVPLMESRLSMVTTLETQIEQGKINNLGGMLFTSDWPGAAYLSAGFGGKNSTETFNTDENGDFMVSYKAYDKDSGEVIDIKNKNAGLLYNSRPPIIPNIKKNITDTFVQMGITNKQLSILPKWFIKDPNNLDEDGNPVDKIFYKIEGDKKIGYKKADMKLIAQTIAPNLGAQAGALLRTEGAVQALNTWFGNNKALEIGENNSNALFGIYSQSDAENFRTTYVDYSKDLFSNKIEKVSSEKIKQTKVKKIEPKLNEETQIKYKEVLNKFSNALSVDSNKEINKEGVDSKSFNFLANKEFIIDGVAIGDIDIEDKFDSKTGTIKTSITLYSAKQDPDDGNFYPINDSWKDADIEDMDKLKELARIYINKRYKGSSWKDGAKDKLINELAVGIQENLYQRFQDLSDSKFKEDIWKNDILLDPNN